MENKVVATSIIYKLIEKILVKGVGLVVSIILARLLAPEVFGVIAIIMAIVAIAQIFVESGLNTALIQAKNIERSDYSTVFYINFAIAFLLYCLLFFLAPLIAAFYEIDEYVLHFRILMLILLFYSINSIQTAKLTREMQFKKMLLAQLISSAVSGVVGIIFAFLGKGIWALVIYYLVNAVVSSIVYGFVSHWRPEFTFSKSRAKVLFGYGSKVFASAFICSLFSNIRTFIIGKKYSSTELGLYSRGDQIPSTISTTIDNTFTSVMLPAFSQQQDNKSEIRAMLKKVISLNAFINFPAMMGLAVIAPVLVEVLYTSAWNECIPFFSILSLANLSVAILPSCLTAIKALGRSDVFLKLEIVRRIVMVIILLISLLFNSLIAIAIGWMISCFIDVFIVLIPTYKLIGYSFYDLFQDTGSSFLISLAMALNVWLVSQINVPLVSSLLLQIITGIVVYIGVSACFKTKNFVSALVIVKMLFKKKDKK